MRIYFFALCMQLVYLPLAVVLFLAGPLLAFAQESYEDPSAMPDFAGTVTLSEVLPNPVGADEAGEFIELVNRSVDDVDLTGWTIEAHSSSGSVSSSVLSGIIEADDHLVLWRVEDAFSFALTNSTMTVVLLAPDGSIVAETTYADVTEGQSWQSIDDAWQWDAPSPGEVNVATSSVDPVEFAGVTFLPLQLSEVFPDPEEPDEVAEFIEVFNPHAESVSLAGWTLQDGSANGRYVFPDDTVIAPQDYIVVHRADFGFALNNSGSEDVSLLAPNGETMDMLTYDGASVGYAYAHSAEGWRWTLEVTPGAANTFPPRPEMDLTLPKNVYRKVPANFAVEVSDVDAQDVRVRWDFGDGGRSTKVTPTHTYADADEFDGSVTVRVGAEVITKTFSVKVTKYPRRSVAITALLPNPEGPDTQQEWVRLTNTDKKAIDLEGWQIAVGSTAERVIARPITEVFTLKSGESFDLTAAYARFTLPNQRGVVQLLRPDGSVADEVAYDLPKPFPNDAIYEKVGSTWQVLATTMPPEDVLPGATAATLIAQAVTNEQARAVPSAEALPQENASVLHEDAPRIIQRSGWVGEIVQFFHRIFGFMRE